MPLKNHLYQSLQLQKAPSPWPRMSLSGLSVALPLVIGFFRGELKMAIFGALFGFIMILNDHFGPLRRRILHLVTAYMFIIGGVLSGMLLGGHGWLILVCLFALSYMLGRAKGLGLELERMLLFTTLQFLAASQTPELRTHFMQAVFYSTLSLCNYIFCLFLVWMTLRHEPNFQKSKRAEFMEAWARKNTQRYAFTMATMACAAFVLTKILKLEKGYWVVGTVLIVMMPDRYQSLYKSFQRLLGTLIGVFVASLLVSYMSSPWFLIFLCSACAFLAPMGLIKNYWLGNVFIAGLILLFLEIAEFHAGMGPFDLALVRIMDIGLGCLIGTIGTFIAFPEILKKRRIKQDS